MKTLTDEDKQFCCSATKLISLIFTYTVYGTIIYLILYAWYLLVSNIHNCPILMTGSVYCTFLNVQYLVHQFTSLVHLHKFAVTPNDAYGGVSAFEKRSNSLQKKFLHF